jgi:hypothetical protein
MDFIGKHRDLAIKLYRQRTWMLKAWQGDSRLLQKIEQRLRTAVAGIVLSTEDKHLQPSDAAGVFVAFAARIVNETREIKLRAIYNEALELLGQKGEIANGVFDALLLYPPPKIDWMVFQYQQQPELRAHLFRLWQAQGAKLPSGLVNQVELQNQDVELQLNTLHFLANSHGYGVGVFSAYYRHLLHISSVSEVNDELIVPAIWGGILRGDCNATKALRIAIDRVTEPKLSYELLRILSLMGSEDDLALFLAYIKRDSAQGYALLALLGRPAVVPYVLQGLASASTLQDAYSAWLTLTNMPLPMRPRFMLVDDNTKRKRHEKQTFDCESIPDAKLAETWWETQKSLWSDGTRWFNGLPMTKENLMHILTRQIGTAAYDVKALLALHLQRPLGLGSGWEHNRQVKLRKLYATYATTTGKHRDVG